MIRVEPLSPDQWLVTVTSRITTQHRVHLDSADLKRFGGGNVTPEELLEASFRFLLERESNTSILGEFDLPVIGRYFPEYEREIGRYLKTLSGVGSVMPESRQPPASGRERGRHGSSAAIFLCADRKFDQARFGPVMTIYGE